EDDGAHAQQHGHERDQPSDDEKGHPLRSGQASSASLHWGGRGRRPLARSSTPRGGSVRQRDVVVDGHQVHARVAVQEDVLDVVAVGDVERLVVGGDLRGVVDENGADGLPVEREALLHVGQGAGGGHELVGLGVVVARGVVGGGVRGPRLGGVVGRGVAGGGVLG